MAGGRSRRRGADYAEFWPGYVDVLSTLLLVVTFLMSIFMLAQYFAAQEATGKDTALKRLNRQIAELTNLLSLEKGKAQGSSDELEASEKKDKDSQDRIKDLGSRLNAALARQVQELQRYRSDFFGRLREQLKDRKDIRVVGDRFVFESEVLFPSGQATLTPEGLAAMDQLATAIVELERQIPKEINWALQVDGHTDVRPIASVQFPSNWELSTARAASVVKSLIAGGVPASRLVVAGYGEFQPIEPGTDEA